jgi:hypothetical protein
MSDCRFLNMVVGLKFSIQKKKRPDGQSVLICEFEIIGWAISRDLSHKFCLQALDIAVKREKPPAGI